jgi:hypothetical protein
MWNIHSSDCSTNRPIFIPIFSRSWRFPSWLRHRLGSSAVEISTSRRLWASAPVSLAMSRSRSSRLGLNLPQLGSTMTTCFSSHNITMTP